MLVLHVAYFEPLVHSSTIKDLHFPGLSMTSCFNFEDFQGPISFSRTVRVLENQEKNSSTLQEAWEPRFFHEVHVVQRMAVMH